jgi:hypothetical protein
MIGTNPEVLFAFTNSLTTEWALRNNRSNWNKTGRLRNYHCGDANDSDLTDKASQPAGNTHPVAYVMAQKPGRISSHKICYIGAGGTAEAKIGSLLFTSSCVVSLDGAATGTLIIGSLIDGTTAIVVDGSAVGKMTLGAAGGATITIEANGAILGHVPAAGSTAILLGAIADLAALGWLAGSGPIELDGTLQSYAVGWLEGSTEDKNTLTTTNIAAAVWNALAAAYNDDGTMGKALGDLGAGANPWESMIEGDHTAQDVLRYLMAFVAGKATGAGTTSISFKSLGGGKDRILLTVDEKGNRTNVVLDGDDE